VEGFRHRIRDLVATILQALKNRGVGFETPPDAVLKVRDMSATFDFAVEFGKVFLERSANVLIARFRAAPIGHGPLNLRFRWRSACLSSSASSRAAPTTKEIEALLADTPDLSKEIAAAEDEDLVELLTRFDVRVTFDKPGRSLEISAAIGLDPMGDIEPEKTTATRPDGDGSQVLSIVGAGFEPATFGLLA
jgi:hypothetical protein